MPRILLFCLAFVLAACGGGNQVITDYSNRAVTYAWLDVTEIPGNTVQYFGMRNLSAPKNERYYPMGSDKMGKGVLVFHAGFAMGRYEFDALHLASCIGNRCKRDINTFDFGPLGSGIGTTLVTKPGVKFAGCWKMVRTKRATARESGGFETKKIRCPYSQRQMLGKMLPRFEQIEQPLPAQRIRAAMR